MLLRDLRFFFEWMGISVCGRARLGWAWPKEAVSVQASVAMPVMSGPFVSA
jgi:hypothetical protein